MSAQSRAASPALAIAAVIAEDAGEVLAAQRPTREELQLAARRIFGRHHLLRVIVDRVAADLMSGPDGSRGYTDQDWAREVARKWRQEPSP